MLDPPRSQVFILQFQTAHKLKRASGDLPEFLAYIRYDSMESKDTYVTTCWVTYI